jgi:hypothetical protein
MAIELIEPLTMLQKNFYAFRFPPDPRVSYVKYREIRLKWLLVPSLGAIYARHDQL